MCHQVPELPHILPCNPEQMVVGVGNNCIEPLVPLYLLSYMLVVVVCAIVTLTINHYNQMVLRQVDISCTILAPEQFALMHYLTHIHVLQVMIGLLLPFTGWLVTTHLAQQ